MAALAALCMGGAATAQDAARDVTIELGRDFTLQPGDVLSVTVLEDTTLNRQVLIRPDGMIALPIAGTIEAAGKKPEGVRAAIESRLADDFVTKPTVTVSLVSLGLVNDPLRRVERALQKEEELETSAVYVLGEVARPGAFPFKEYRPITALQALALAGGPGVFAATGRIQIRRQMAEGERIITFSYEDVQDGLVMPEALTLTDGDVIVVPERGLFE